MYPVSKNLKPFGEFEAQKKQTRTKKKDVGQQ